MWKIYCPESGPSNEQIPAIEFDKSAHCSGVERCFWARGLTVVWGRWSPPTLSGVCGVCIPTPTGKFWILHIPLPYINFGAILCRSFRFTKVYSTIFILQNSVTKTVWIGMTIFTRYIANNKEVWQYAAVHAAVPLPLALTCRGAQPPYFFEQGGLSPPCSPGFYAPALRKPCWNELSMLCLVRNSQSLWWIRHSVTLETKLGTLIQLVIGR